MREELAVRFIMGSCVLATLATIFLFIVATPVLLVIGFSGHFALAWNFVAEHPVLVGFLLAGFMALVMVWIWLMLVIGASLMRGN